MKGKRAGKTYKSKSGYLKFKDSGKPVHRWRAEKKLGRKLESNEVVHHKNRDKLDNSFGNLVVLSSQKKHWQIHKKDAKNYGWQYSMTGKNKQGK